MLSQELEFCLNDAFAGAREARHEFMTVEHLLLAIVDTPKVREILKSCGADTAEAQDRAQAVHRPDHAAPADRRGPRRAADPGLPARAAARGVPRAIERQERGHGRQRAGRDIQREADPRGLPAEHAGRVAARRGQFHRPRPVEGRRRGAQRARGERRRRAMPSATATAAAARSRSTPPTSTRPRARARSIL